MTKRIGTGASLADFTRRDFLASKDLTVASPVSLHAPMPRR
ncbi:hypothetical protein [Mesorhizobium temperatum]|nr:hypothetical protein [Mesorhizobium temperatum]